MKVLIVAPHIKIPGLSGAAVHHTEFSKSLAKLGVEVHILADSKKEIRIGKKIFLHPSNASNIPPKRFLTSLNSIQTAVEICKKYNIQIIHDRCDPGQMTGYFLKKILNLPKISEVNENQLAYEAKGNFFRDVLSYPFLILIKKMWLKRVVPSADLITVVSDTIKKSMIRNGIEGKKVKVIPNGSSFIPVKKKMPFGKLGIGSKDIVVTIVGELGPRQGIVEIVRSFASMKNNNLKLILVGGEDRYQKYLNGVKKFVAENGLQKKIIFLNRIERDDMESFLAAVDYAIAPYRESWNGESFGFCPLKVLDYMATKKIVIATDTPWTREIIQNGKDGFLVNFENFSKEMNDIIEKLSRNRNLRRKIEASAAKKIRDNFTWKGVAERYKIIYSSLVNS